ncbi:CBM21 domain-containing protein [Inconstantimicrobium mannanitabidum]|uniref:Uncharacterized protein n=1 Tax=Inconstantimicrobium mannanitabidum TaxID=1604901 RepID=A0ACB5RD95_9CLOT|nr:CBM21 domain-containing protein [Clostridium sp. TW13]GKX67018.1 hypothetical protein rsdtw13_22760 [Clostridium sp. TW13]
MKSKCLIKLMSGLVATTCLLAPIQASASTVATAKAQPTVAAATVTDQVVKLDSITSRSIANIHDDNNYWHAPYAVEEYTAYVLVENKSYDKTIVLHYIDADGVWKDSEKATYVETRSDGKELWVLHGFVGGNAIFAVNYKEANAWDNNNGLNYRLYNN